jgi:hypothetical protein
MIFVDFSSFHTNRDFLRISESNRSYKNKTTEVSGGQKGYISRLKKET